MGQQTLPTPVEESIFEEGDFTIYDKHVRSARQMLYWLIKILVVPDLVLGIKNGKQIEDRQKLFKKG